MFKEMQQFVLCKVANVRQIYMIMFRLDRDHEGLHLTVDDKDDSNNHCYHGDIITDLLSTFKLK